MARACSPSLYAATCKVQAPREAEAADGCALVEAVALKGAVTAGCESRVDSGWLAAAPPVRVARDCASSCRIGFSDSNLAVYSSVIARASPALPITRGVISTISSERL